MDAVDAHHVRNHVAETWPTVTRGLGVGALTVGVYALTPPADRGATVRYVLLVLALIASPALLRTIIAPHLARLLKETT